MLSIIDAVCHLCIVSFMLSVVKNPVMMFVILLSVIMVIAIRAECFFYFVIYVETHLCWAL